MPYLTFDPLVPGGSGTGVFLSKRFQSRSIRIAELEGYVLVMQTQLTTPIYWIAVYWPQPQHVRDRNHSRNYEKILRFIQKYLLEAREKNFLVFVAGDFNQNWENASSPSLLQLLEEHNLIDVHVTSHDFALEGWTNRIDYMYATVQFRPRLISTAIERSENNFTDHPTLYAKLNVQN
jgi:exonuclease III